MPGLAGEVGDLSVSLGLLAVKPFDGTVGCGSSGEDGLLVALHDLEPVRDVVRVVVTQGRRHAQVDTEERGPELGDQLLGAALLCPEASGEVSIQSRLVTGGVDSPMEPGRL